MRKNWCLECWNTNLARHITIRHVSCRARWNLGLSVRCVTSLLDKHAPIITKISNRKSKSNSWFSHPLRAFRTALRHAESIYKRTHSALDWSKFKSSLRNRYHHLILDSKNNNIFPNWSLHHLIIHVVSDKLSINSWTANLLHLYLPHLQPLQLLIALLPSSTTRYPSSVSH